MGQASAIYAKLEAEARGQYGILAKKAEGLRLLVEGCGGAQAAFQMLMLEHMDKLSETAAHAISSIKFDKVIVWDGGASASGPGATAGFLQSLTRGLPPMMQIMRDVGGVEMPEYFGKLVHDAAPAPAAAQPSPAATATAAPPAGPPPSKDTPKK